MALPLLLAGPILRRVEPTLVAVWVALRDAADVRLHLWEGRVASGAANVFVSTDAPGTRTLRVGSQLHLALVVLKIPATSAKKLQPGRTYAYDLEIRTAAGTQTLNTLGLLRSATVAGKRIEALGYDDGMLPSFALPPAALTDLRVVFGSCRRALNDHLDAMVWIDDLMRPAGLYPHTDPLKRPHQLFLGGDQIYADDVSPLHLRLLLDLAPQMMGRDANGQALEHLMVDQVRKARVAGPKSFDDYGDSLKRDSPGAQPADFVLPADQAHFPAGRRYLLTTVDAQMTTTDAEAHLFALGEFAGLYLTMWSNALWPSLPDPPGTPPVLALPADDALLVPAWPAVLPTFVDAPLNDRETRGADDPLSPFRHYDALRDPVPDTRPPAERQAALDAHVAAVRRRLQAHRVLATTFAGGLAKVQRVLANVPTYMMFDDHDVTDDWNLNPLWLDRVMTTSLGVTTLRNALLAYALFQDWGNNPRAYESGAKKTLLELVPQLFPPATKGPVPAVANQLDHLFGFDLAGEEQADGRVGAVSPPVKWHFSVPGPKHLAVALDNRTRRSYLSRHGPPGNLGGSLDAALQTVQTEQIPAGPFSDGKQVLLVIAPLQVLGPPILDELVAPAAYRAFDIKEFDDKQPGLRSGARGMTGTNPDAIEAWAFDPVTLEALLKRLAPYRSVVLLSGDVHYSASNVMSYWLKGQAEPARFVQFTSSGFKNVMPSYITVVDRSLAIAHRIVRAGVGAERLGWMTVPTNPIQLPPGARERDIPRALRARLRRAPVMVPTYGWPAGSKVNPAAAPDWSWRVEPLFDTRADAQRPPATRPLPIDTGAVEARLAEAGGPRAIEAYQALAARHQAMLERQRNSRQILFRSNFGVVRFEQRSGVLHAVHEMITARKPPGDLGSDPPQPAVFVLHSAALSAPDAVRPEARMGAAPPSNP